MDIADLDGFRLNSLSSTGNIKCRVEWSGNESLSYPRDFLLSYYTGSTTSAPLCTIFITEWVFEGREELT